MRMIIKLKRGVPPGSPWMLYGDPTNEDPVIDVIEPTIDMLMLMGAEHFGYFEAEEVDGEWDVHRRIESQGW